MKWESINDREDRSDKLTVVGGRFRTSHADWFITLADEKGAQLELNVNKFTQFVDSTGGSVISLSDNDVVRVISDKKHKYMRAAMIVTSAQPVELVDHLPKPVRPVRDATKAERTEIDLIAAGFVDAWTPPKDVRNAFIDMIDEAELTESVAFLITQAILQDRGLR
ncbi:hypothetical protein [Ochrobactrum sp. BTU2]|uniref:hypothetical protein n=1 Tax=Ochrobactrum sp. BTU2 TaxID=2856166 RepID=UPI00211A4E70|nr:hypothetical protein [Ochrobactrum sp. BTU2]MCQ9146093.1 hypothetical protein [Ochrobactrum sp. BTU2]